MGSGDDQQLMLPLTPVQLEKWFRAAGLRTWKDAVGNVHGRADSAHPGQPAVLLGSHYDTVRDAGKFDGALGIIVGLAALEGLLMQVSRRAPGNKFALLACTTRGLLLILPLAGKALCAVCGCTRLPRF